MHLEYPYSVHHSIIPDNLCNEIIEEGEKLIKFWQKYFKDMNSGMFELDPIEG